VTASRATWFQRGSRQNTTRLISLTHCSFCCTSDNIVWIWFVYTGRWTGLSKAPVYTNHRAILINHSQICIQPPPRRALLVEASWGTVSCRPYRYSTWRCSPSLCSEILGEGLRGGGFWRSMLHVSVTLSVLRSTFILGNKMYYL